LTIRAEERVGSKRVWSCYDIFVSVGLSKGRTAKARQAEHGKRETFSRTHLPECRDGLYRRALVLAVTWLQFSRYVVFQTSSLLTLVLTTQKLPSEKISRKLAPVAPIVFFV
jgi:hypothetical protein